MSLFVWLIAASKSAFKVYRPHFTSTWLLLHYKLDTALCTGKVFSGSTLVDLVGHSMNAGGMDEDAIVNGITEHKFNNDIICVDVVDI